MARKTPKKRKKPPVKQKKARTVSQYARAVKLAKTIAGQWFGDFGEGLSSGEVTLSFERFTDSRLWGRYLVEFDNAIPVKGNIKTLVNNTKVNWRSLATLYRKECRENVQALRVDGETEEVIFQTWLTVFYEPHTTHAKDRCQALRAMVIRGTSLGEKDFIQAFELVARAPSELEAYPDWRLRKSYKERF